MATVSGEATGIDSFSPPFRSKFFHVTELKIRGGTEDNLKIIFLIFLQNHML